MNLPPNSSTTEQFLRYARSRNKRDAVAHANHKEKLAANSARRSRALRQQREHAYAKVNAINAQQLGAPIDRTPQLRKRGE